MKSNIFPKYSSGFESVVLSDEQLFLSFAKENNRGNFSHLVERYTTKAFKVAYGYVLSTPDAEDAVQEAFIRIMKNADKFKESETFAPWFFTILRRICIDIIRKRKIRNLFTLEQNHEPTIEIPDDGIPLSVLNKLSKQEQEVLHLKLVGELSFKEIADIVKCSEDAAKKRSQRGLQHLRELLKKDLD